MNRIELMELVRGYQIGRISRRDFLMKATATVGLAATHSLLAACAASPENPAPVVDDSESTAISGTTTENGQTTGIVTYPAKEGDDLMGYISFAADGDARPAVIVLQEWWGLNDHIKDVTDRIAAEGYVALAPDLYHGVVTTEPDEARKQAMELGMRDAVGEIEQAVNYVKGLSNVSGGIGVVGFCMGGRLVYQSVANIAALSAGAGFYGSPLNASEAAQVAIPTISFLGSADGISSSSVQAMHDVFESNNVPNAFHLYDGAQHSFFNDTRASYDADAAADSWQKLLAWFETHL